MRVERYVDKKILWLIFAVMAVGSVVMFYFGTIHRFTYASQYENYSEVGGWINSIQEYSHEDSDDDSYYTYSAEIEYIVDGTEYVKVTDDIFSEDNVPKEGRRVPILYNNDNPNDYVVAKEDWMTHSLVPVSDKGDYSLFASLILLGFALIVLAMVLDNEQARGILLGSGSLLIGIDGVVMGVIVSNFTMFSLVIFGALGVFVLYQCRFVPKKRR